jgi:tetratricopeptide (TPR) repeat protein
MTFRYLGILQSSRGLIDEAEASHRQALKIWRQAGEKDLEAGELSNLSGVLESQGRLEESLEIKQDALVALVDYYGEEHPVVATVRNNIAYSLHRDGDYETAEKLYRQALEVNERLLGPDHVGTADFLTNLGRLLMDQGRYEEAEPYVRRATDLRQKHNEPTQFHRIAAEINLASLQLELGEVDQSIAGYRSALERFEDLVGPSHNATARVQCLLGLALYRRGDLIEAETLLRTALATQTANGVAESQVAETREGLDGLLTDQGRTAEADALR